ncbi:MAG: DUF805 domain-containing protein [Thermoguttaceae bacterium]|nr:DUF805 domain-containing protein [Thermoguttaceae bacterium]
MKRCVKCGTETIESFCPNCGAPIPADNLESFSRFWKRAFDYKSRASRREYWFALFWEALIVGALLFVGFAPLLFGSGDAESSDDFRWRVRWCVLAALWLLASAPSLICLVKRRLNDAGFVDFPWKPFLCLAFVFPINIIELVALGLVPSKRDEEISEGDLKSEE